MDETEASKKGMFACDCWKFNNKLMGEFLVDEAEIYM